MYRESTLSNERLMAFCWEIGVTHAEQILLPLTQNLGHSTRPTAALQCGTLQDQSPGGDDHRPVESTFSSAYVTSG
ncbi:hypothetical protein AMELA_G00211760 [Ameiurus melas]|uniref:Uncharacterized protein n=1 Tax=Ameiurus melas TaxID=219545 RepID=A0A7J6A6G6_AMEME|nr:hypothetical protein AMELA_G00211760 [Ameiurus melas]